MLKSVKKVPSNISVDLEEPLTAHSCSQLVIEIIKYIMYQKQQIPFSGDTLTKLHANTKPTDRNYSSMKKLIDSMNSVTDHLSNELIHDKCDVKEILIMIGATIFMPKLCIKLELPNILDNTHIQKLHPHQKQLLNVMKSILGCSEFQEELSRPLVPTNTFILVQKRDPRSTSEFFIPKPQFALTTRNMACFNISLNYDKNRLSSCECNNMHSRFPIYNDVRESGLGISLCPSFNINLNAWQARKSRTEDHTKMKKARSNESDLPYLWYQSKEVFKGFKFIS